MLHGPGVGWLMSGGIVESRVQVKKGKGRRILLLEIDLSSPQGHERIRHHATRTKKLSDGSDGIGSPWDDGQARDLLLQTGLDDDAVHWILWFGKEREECCRPRWRARAKPERARNPC